jgi:saxitoxin biosynthesis operon SxtJ-like protein
MFALIGLWPAIVRGAHARAWMVGVAVGLVLPALAAPRVLAPAYRAWMALGSVLGWVNTRVMLGLLFFGVITPTALILRLIRRDPMRVARDPGASTYRVPRRPRPGSHMMRQF